MTDLCGTCKSKSLIKCNLILKDGQCDLRVLFDEATIPPEYIGEFMEYLQLVITSWSGWEKLDKFNVSDKNATVH